MAEEKWHGIPRSEIPWCPTIDYEKCVSCGKCVDYCKLGTFEFEEKEGEKKTIVKNPNNCVVLCTGCDESARAGLDRTVRTSSSLSLYRTYPEWV